MNFTPEQPENAQSVPYYEDVTSQDGWQGQDTTKSMETLKSEIVQSISRLGGLVVGFQRGKFAVDEQSREGFRVHYSIEATNGKMIAGRIDIAALPVKPNVRYRKSSVEKQREKSLKMALFMFREAMNGTWFLQQLSPGYAALIPWMLMPGGDKTLTQLWSESSAMSNLLPPGGSEFVDGAFTVKEK